MTKLDTLEVSIELLRQAHKRLYAAGETELATEISHVVLKAHDRRKKLRSENA